MTIIPKWKHTSQWPKNLKFVSSIGQNAGWACLRTIGPLLAICIHSENETILLVTKLQFEQSLNFLSDEAYPHCLVTRRPRITLSWLRYTTSAIRVVKLNIGLAHCITLHISSKLLILASQRRSVDFHTLKILIPWISSVKQSYWAKFETINWIQRKTQRVAQITKKYKESFSSCRILSLG